MLMSLPHIIGLSVVLFIFVAAFIAIAVCLYLLHKRDVKRKRELLDQRGTTLATYNRAYDTMISCRHNENRIDMLERAINVGGGPVLEALNLEIDQAEAERAAMQNMASKEDIARGPIYTSPGTVPLTTEDACVKGTVRRRAAKFDQLAQSSSRMDNSAREFDELATAVNDQYRGPEAKKDKSPSPTLRSVSAFLTSAKNKFTGKEQST